MRRIFWVVIGLALFAAAWGGAKEANACWFTSCFGTKNTTFYAPAVPVYAAAPASCGPVCNPCQQSVGYAPQAVYRPIVAAPIVAYRPAPIVAYRPAPIVAYRPVATCNSCAPATTAYRPVSLAVPQTAYLPYSTFRPVYTPLVPVAAAPITTYYAPPAVLLAGVGAMAPAAGEPALPGSSCCGAGGMATPIGTISSPANTTFAAPATSSSSPSDAAHSVQRTSGDTAPLHQPAHAAAEAEGTGAANQAPIRDDSRATETGKPETGGAGAGTNDAQPPEAGKSGKDSSENSTKLPKLLGPENQTARNFRVSMPYLRTVKRTTVAPAGQPEVDSDGWSAAR